EDEQSYIVDLTDEEYRYEITVNREDAGIEDIVTEKNEGQSNDMASGGGEETTGERTSEEKSAEGKDDGRSEEHTSELQSRFDLVCRLLLEKQQISKKQALQLRILNLNAVVRELEPRLRRLIREDIELDVRPAARHPWIRVVVSPIGQVSIS